MCFVLLFSIVILFLVLCEVSNGQMPIIMYDEDFVDIRAQQNPIFGPQKTSMIGSYDSSHLDIHSLKNMPKKNNKISYSVFRRQNKDHCDSVPTDMQEITQYTGYQSQSRMNPVL